MAKKCVEDLALYLKPLSGGKGKFIRCILKCVRLGQVLSIEFLTLTRVTAYHEIHSVLDGYISIINFLVALTKAEL